MTEGKVRLWVAGNDESFRLSGIRLPELPESIFNLLPNCTLDLAELGAESKRKPPVDHQEAQPLAPPIIAELASLVELWHCGP
jgi:hypothetical protein